MIKKKQTLKIPTSYFQQRGVSLSYYTSRNHVWCFPLINHSTDPASPGSGSQGSNRVVYSPEERKLRRMKSNRESARRSRYRKKQHMENLTSQLNQLRIQNRLIKNQLASTMHQQLLLSLHNDHLKSESVALMATLSDLCGILGTMLSH